MRLPLALTPRACRHDRAVLRAAASYAARCRGKLVAFLKEHNLRMPTDACPICMEPLHMAKATASADKAVLLLACLHPVHDVCFKTYLEVAQKKSPEGPVSCPTCREPVPLV